MLLFTEIETISQVRMAGLRSTSFVRCLKVMRNVSALQTKSSSDVHRLLNGEFLLRKSVGAWFFHTAVLLVRHRFDVEFVQKNLTATRGEENSANKSAKLRKLQKELNEHQTFIDAHEDSPLLTMFVDLMRNNRDFAFVGHYGIVRHFVSIFVIIKKNMFG
jgi:hypothetical protein